MNERAVGVNPATFRVFKQWFYVDRERFVGLFQSVGFPRQSNEVRMPPHQRCIHRFNGVLVGGNGDHLWCNIVALAAQLIRHIRHQRQCSSTDVRAIHISKEHQLVVAIWVFLGARIIVLIRQGVITT